MRRLIQYVSIVLITAAAALLPASADAATATLSGRAFNATSGVGYADGLRKA